MLDKKFTLLVVMNIILMILCSSFLIKDLVEDKAAPEAPANLQRSDEPVREEVALEKKVNSALEKVSTSTEPTDRSKPTSLTTELAALSDSDTKTETRLDAAPETTYEIAETQNQAQLATQSAKVQAIYQEQADLYKQRLLAN